MTPGARLAAVIELLEILEADPRPADRVLGEYFASRRYAGSKDRRAVGDLFFTVLRNQAAIDWWVARVGGAPTSRGRALAGLLLAAGRTGEEV